MVYLIILKSRGIISDRASCKGSPKRMAVECGRYRSHVRFTFLLGATSSWRGRNLRST